MTLYCTISYYIILHDCILSYIILSIPTVSYNKLYFIVYSFIFQYIIITYILYCVYVCQLQLVMNI